ncbi:single-stranded-DNA-specific exonuclease RecJ [Paenalkalicoccus suaedae]|uniref:Single-stranded-DNA-specific exonuclease RecJ n=1 Tax=Paenalkalicoccus suaedae TaxID=2592382 RepID=A0A859FD87_9BACI|nr:single-stranded-DNA-specific exonuclease RecJ [Paenalkalicoccus suaedae]QKS70781.1 single-stranded-DNA-specific exonuclease RecJ [Paenalkalicoccus suaedae]
MLRSRANWIVNEPDEEQVTELSANTGLSMIAARFLVQRNKGQLEDARAFLDIDERLLHDPFELKDMRRAVDRIHTAIEGDERILIFGDYDADGVTSTSVLYLTLRELQANVSFYIPNRFTEGYGPNEPAFRHAKEEGVSLIISVDTGISAVHEADVAKELGIDFIITDHHEPPPTIPDGYAVINPKQEDCSYPFPNLAGVGVTFKLAHALMGRVPEEFYDLVAIGTIADLVPLEDENRFLAKMGLKRMRQQLRPGLRALLTKASASIDELDEETVGFMIGPRLNAAGRLDSADPAVELLLSEDAYEAEDLATLVDDLNKERQKIVKDISEEAIAMVEAQGVPSVIIVGKEGWNAGVIGIVASRLVEKYYRPTIVMSHDLEKGLAKGSARSIEGFDMFHSLSQMRELLPHFGGHPMAAGLTMKLQDVDEVHKRLIEIADTTLTDDDWVRKLHVDLPVQVDEVTVEAIKDLKQMAPFGVGNPAPKVYVKEANVERMKRIGATSDHIKFSLVQDGSMLDAIGFQMGELYERISPIAPLSAVGKLSLNEWNGSVKPQLMLEDVKVSDWQLFDLRGDENRLKSISIPDSEDVKVVQFQEGHYALPDGWRARDKSEAMNASSVLLLDLPQTFEELEEFLSQNESLERLFVVFAHDAEYFFTSVPSRDQFKWFYAFMKKRKQLDLNKHGKDLAKHKGWSERTISFICQVFSELEFVKIENGVVELLDEPQKRDLTASTTYKKHLQKSEMQEKLIYSSYQDLKKTFDSWRTEVRLGSAH